MNKATTSVLSALVFLLLFPPLATGISALFGYTFELRGEYIFVILIMLLVITLVALCIYNPISEERKVLRALLALSPLFSLGSTVFFMFLEARGWFFICLLITVGCCFYLAVKFGRPKAVKITSLVVGALALIPVITVSLVLTLFCFGMNRVVQTVPSPRGTFFAELIDSDEGALGGKTLVKVYKKQGIDLGFFRISKAPEYVYDGEYGEFKNMKLHWKNENCLVINSVEYPIGK